MGKLIEIKDRTLCPFCQQVNQCGVSRCSDSETCWCFHAQVPKALLDLLPEQRDKSCICTHCIQAFKADANLFVQQLKTEFK